MKRDTTIKLILVALIVLGVTLFFTTGLSQYLTLESVKGSQERFRQLYAQNAVGMIALFAAVYIPVIALNLPGAAILGLVAGALFGTLTGTVIISFASSIGATLACLLCRYLLRDWVQNKFGDRLARVNQGIREEGAFYLFSLRLIPVIPFFIINMVMGLTSIRIWTFYWVSQVGMLPGSFLFVNAGSQLAQIESLSGIISPKLILSLALLGLFPLMVKKAIQRFGGRFRRSTVNRTRLSSEQDSPEGKTFKAELTKIREGCTQCGACRTQCAFLQKHGLPKTIADIIDPSIGGNPAVAFECSLCGLCAEVCPEKLAPGDFFLSARRKAAAAGKVDFSRYGAILGYEKRGSSPLFTYYGLPQECDTVFFPGCTLPGTRPETTWRLFKHLQRAIPNLGIVLDCCTKPSHDLGRQAHFEAMFDEMRDYLAAANIRKVLVACPNCYKLFKQYGSGIVVQTIYEHLAYRELPENIESGNTQKTEEWSVHDPCQLRWENAPQEAVRALLQRMGFTVSEMKHNRRRTLCCGEGGSVGFVQPQLAKGWGRVRKSEAAGRRIVAYCAGCTGFLSRVTPTVHIADLIFNPDQCLKGNPKVSAAPWTYLNRIKLKRRFQKHLKTAKSRVRTFCCEKQSREKADACTLLDCKRTLRNKAIATAVILLVCAALFFTISHFMYILDSYVYTAEFHAMFMENNLKKGDSGLFAEYFRSLGPLAGIPNLMIAHLFQSLVTPLAGQVLTSAVIQAFGTLTGALLILLSYLLVGGLAFGAGRYLLGDLLPFLRRTKAPLNGWIYPSLALLTAIPYIPVALPAFIGAITRARLKSFSLIMAVALLARLAWELALPAWT